MRSLCLSLLAAIVVAFPMAVHAQDISAPPYSIIEHQASSTVLEPSLDAAAPLTLESAIELAFAANARLAAARHELDAMDASIVQAGARPNPQLAALMEDTRRETRATTLQWNQPIELGGKREARVAAAERAFDTAGAELAIAGATLRAKLITAFFDVLVAQERWRLANTSMQLAERATGVASRRVAAGKISPVAETKARVAEAGVRVEQRQALSELSIARHQLASLIGQSEPQFSHVEGPLDPPVPITDSFDDRIEQAPELIRAQREFQRRQALAQLERVRAVPDLTVSFGIKRDEELDRNQAVIGLSIPIPVFDQNQGNVREALARAEKARDELLATRLRLQVDAIRVREQLNTSAAEANTFKNEILPGAQSAFDAASRGFEAGKFSFLDVLDAQRSLLQAKALYLHALAEAHRAAADIDRLFGMQSTPSLNSLKD